MASQPPDELRIKISQGRSVLAPHLRLWVDEHLIAPRQVRLALDVDGTSFKDLWLVTDHVGERDSSYRIVYDGETGTFGLEVALESGVEWYMGNYGSFADTVQNM